MAWVNGEEVEPAGMARYEEFRGSLPVLKARHWDAAEERVLESTYETADVEVDEWGVITVLPGLLCPGYTQKYTTLPPVHCARAAGAGTDHEGIGLCSTHKGAQGAGRIQGAIELAIRFADEMNVTPWEALLSQVRLLANQVAWLRVRVGLAEDEHGVDGIKPGGPGWEWVALLEARGDRLAKVSKMAIDAGVAERLVHQLDLEADKMVAAASALADHLGLEGTARDVALEFFGMKLMELEGAAE